MGSGQQGAPEKEEDRVLERKIRAAERNATGEWELKPDAPEQERSMRRLKIKHKILMEECEAEFKLKIQREEAKLRLQNQKEQNTRRHLSSSHSGLEWNLDDESNKEETPGNQRRLGEVNRNAAINSDSSSMSQFHKLHELD